MITNKPNTALQTNVGMWIGARDYETGAIETRGFWDGDDHKVFNMTGGARTYYSLKGGFNIPLIQYSKGDTVQSLRISLGPLASYVQDYIRGFIMRNASVEIHSFTRPPNGAWTAESILIGFIDEVTDSETSVDANGNTTVSYEATVTSESRMGTRTLSLKKSDATQRLINPNDRGRRYSSISGEVKVIWMGEGTGYDFRKGGRDPRNWR